MVWSIQFHERKSITVKIFSVSISDVIILGSLRYLIRDVIELTIGCFWFAHEIAFDQEDSITGEKFVNTVQQ